MVERVEVVSSGYILILPGDPVPEGGYVDVFIEDEPLDEKQVRRRATIEKRLKVRLKAKDDK